MITERQQEQATLYAVGALSPAEQEAFELEMSANSELQSFARELQSVMGLVAHAAPSKLPAGLKHKVMRRIDETIAADKPKNILPLPLAGLSFALAAANSGWKALPIPGASIKLLSLESDRGYAVLLGKLEPGARYPEHINAGPEDVFILAGDLVVGTKKLVAGDFHHASAGSLHEENYSVAGCTLIAVLTTDDPLVAFAQAQ